MWKFTWPAEGQGGITFLCVCNQRKPEDLRIVDDREGRRAITVSQALTDLGAGPEKARELMRRIAQNMATQPDQAFEAQQWGCAAFAVRSHAGTAGGDPLLRALFTKTLRTAATAGSVWKFVALVYPGIVSSASVERLLQYLENVFPPDELRRLWKELILIRCRHEADGNEVPSDWREHTAALWRRQEIAGQSLTELGEEAEREGCLWRLLRQAERAGQLGIAAALAAEMKIAGGEAARLRDLAQKSRQAVSLACGEDNPAA